MASRGIKAAPRGKPSGIPFHARFTDVAAQAGIKTPVVCGHLQRADYVIEAMSCGVAFFDYDNDGWLDILVLTGSRFGDPPPTASKRLYKNNRDGTFTDVTKSAGLFRTGYEYGITVGDYNNDGFEDLFITGWDRNTLYRNNGDGTFTDVTKEAGLLNAHPRFGFRVHLGGLRPRWPARPVRFQLSHLRHRYRAARRPVQQLQYRKAVLRASRAALRPPLPLPQQRRRNLHRRHRESGNRQRRPAAMASPRWPPISTTTGGPISTWPATPLPA